MKTVKKVKAYAKAGVDVDLGNQVKSGIHAKVSRTHGPNVLGKIGGFGGLFRADFGAMEDPVLVSSIDGVGTKLKIAFELGRHDTVGQDLVNHCVNDIAVIGAKPLFFLDYIGSGKLDPKAFDEMLSGFTKACLAAGCALIGGETAQMPGMYKAGEYDLAGCIVGVVDRPKMLDGSRIEKGDVIIGLTSSGLHTNGYSLARKVLLTGRGAYQLNDRVEGLKRSLGDELLAVHKNYQPLLASLPDGFLKGAAHITGGGLLDNLPRVLPKSLNARIDSTSWTIPPLFQLIQKRGKVDPLEMFQVFNMGIGMALVVSPENARSVLKATKGRCIGEIVEGAGTVEIV